MHDIDLIMHPYYYYYYYDNNNNNNNKGLYCSFPLIKTALHLQCEVKVDRLYNRIMI